MRLLITFLCLSLSALGQAVMPDTSANNTYVDTTTTNPSIASFTIANNPNRLLVLAVAVRASGTVYSSCTWDVAGVNEALTQQVTASGGAVVKAEIWTLTNPTAKTATVECTTTSARQQAIVAYSFWNVDQTTPVRNTASDANDPEQDSSTLSVTTEDGDHVVSIVNAGSTALDAVADVDPGVGETEGLVGTPTITSPVNHNTIQSSRKAAASGAATTTSMAPDWTAHSSEITPFAHVVISIAHNPAAGTPLRSVIVK